MEAEKQQQLSPLATQLQMAESSPIAIANCMEIELNQALQYIFVLIGISANKIPTMEIEQVVLSDFIRTSYPRLKVDELKLAFVLAMRRVYDVNLELYDKMFSCLYLSSIVSAYIKWKIDIKKNIRLQEPTNLLLAKVELKESDIIRMEDEHRMALEEIIKKEGKLPITWGWNKVYQSLKRNNLIADTIEEEEMFQQMTIAMFEQEANQNRINKKIKIPILVDYELLLKNESVIQEYIKKERIRVYYQQHLNK